MRKLNLTELQHMRELVRMIESGKTNDGKPATEWMFTLEAAAKMADNISRLIDEVVESRESVH